MSLHLRSVVIEGLSRAFTRNGILLFVALLVGGLVQFGLVRLVTTTYLPLSPTVPTETATTPVPGSQLPLLLAVPAGFLGGITGGLLTIPIQVVANRTLVSEQTERIPEEYVFRRLGWATVHTFLASVAVSVVVFVVALLGLAVGFAGLVFALTEVGIRLSSSLVGQVLLAGLVVVLLVPSVLLSVSLAFTGQEIAVRDKTAVGGILGSWRLTRGVRLRLLALVAVPLVVQLPLSIVLSEAFPWLVANGVSVVETTAVSFLMLAIMARAYRQQIPDSAELATLGVS